MIDASIISEGDYVIVKRNQFVKLHQYSSKNSLMLGKDKVNLSCIEGKPEWTLFKMVPKKNSKREYILEVSSKADSVENSVMKDVTSGLDNRNIVNDNKSQLLSSEEINGMRESGLSSCGIVSALIENSTTFKNKTEYSQVKYLKKKMKKYHEYIVIRKPTIRMLAEILFNKDQFKILGLRYDSLSQIISAANIQPNGVYMLYENGTQGLVGAALLNSLSGSSAIIINLSSYNQPQKQAILAMNFSKNKLNCLLTVKITSLLGQLNRGSDDISEKLSSFCDEGVKSHQLNDPISSSDSQNEFVNKQFDCSISKGVKNKTNDSGFSDENMIGLCSEDKKNEKDSESMEGESGGSKRKSESLEQSTVYLSKRPKWSDDLDSVCKILAEKKTDGLIIACKEFPLELLNTCLGFVNKSRPLVIYSVFREPLVELYIELKKKKNILGLHLTETWLREYQVLEGRTHPTVSMSPSGGYLLTATVV